ncbi:hypothetical protein PaeBR_08585 [Paenibacillus sp. BR2-3]|uniref:hypothetical protein n=1 Tax=Paenibacillus sp. BR2-3 TaxID=3048494 RepID=UPI0039778952
MTLKKYYTVGIYQQRSADIIIMKPSVWSPVGYRTELNLQYKLEGEDINAEALGTMLIQCLARSMENTSTLEERAVPKSGIFSTNGKMTKNLRRQIGYIYPGKHYKFVPLRAEKKGYFDFENDALDMIVPLECSNTQLGNAILETFKNCT